LLWSNRSHVSTAGPTFQTGWGGFKTSFNKGLKCVAVSALGWQSAHAGQKNQDN
jgi:hypothetical protein